MALMAKRCSFIKSIMKKKGVKEYSFHIIDRRHRTDNAANGYVRLFKDIGIEATYEYSSDSADPKDWGYTFKLTLKEGG